MLKILDNLIINATEWQASPFRFNVSALNFAEGETEPTYEDVVVSGFNSITLTNAKANSLSYLKLFGACEQASTPTPSSPVNISCNNGTLKVRDKELPSGYKRVKDIIYNNNIYFVTAYTMSGSDTMKVSFTKTTSGACNLVGAYDGSSPVNTNYSIYLTNSSTGKYLRYNGNLYNSYAVQDTRYDLIMSPTGTQGMEVDSTWEEKEFTSTNTFCIGTTSVSATSSKFVGIIHENVEIVNKATFIPCERESDSELGYYDTTAQVFLENQGTGTPTTSGYDFEHLEIYVDGTAEKVRINPKNLFDKDAITQGYVYNSNLEYVSSSSAYLTDFIKVSASTNYVCSYTSTGSGIARINYFDSNKDILSQTTANTYSDSTPFTFTTPSSTAYIRISFNSNYVSAATVQIEQGTTATTYQPYIAATAQNLLGLGDYQDIQEVLAGHVTRKIGMMILTGEEDWSTTSSAITFKAPLRDNPEYEAPDSELACMCTHYVGEKPKVTVSSMSNNTIKCGYKNTGYSPTGYIYLKDNSFEGVSDVTDYLAGQYANGTPVILVYPLDITTTETVTAHHLQIEEGTNIIAITQASINSLGLEAKYKALVVPTTRTLGEYMVSPTPVVNNKYILADGSLLTTTTQADYVNDIKSLYEDDPTQACFQQPVQVLDFNEHGTLSYSDGVLSGFSNSGNYASLASMPDLNSCSTWEIGIKFKQTSTTSSSQHIISSSSSGIIVVIFVSQTTNKLGYSGPSFDYTSDYTISLNTWYWAKFRFTGTQYVLSVSTDGETYTDVYTYNSSTKVTYNANDNFNIGISRKNNEKAFLGSIDMKETYIIRDGVEYWRGIATQTGETAWQTVDTYNGCNGAHVYDPINETVRIPHLGSYMTSSESYGQIVGNLTINDGIVSGFSNNDYILTPEFDVTNASKWQIQLTFTTGTMGTQSSLLFPPENYVMEPFIIMANAGWLAYISTNGTSWNIDSNLIFTLSANTTYKLLAEYTGSYYRFYQWNGSSWTQKKSISNSNKVKKKAQFMLGKGFNGSINLKESYFSIDGVKTYPIKPKQKVNYYLKIKE